MDIKKVTPFLIPVGILIAGYLVYLYFTDAYKTLLLKLDCFSGKYYLDKLNNATPQEKIKYKKTFLDIYKTDTKSFVKIILPEIMQHEKNKINSINPLDFIKPYSSDFNNSFAWLVQNIKSKIQFSYLLESVNIRDTKEQLIENVFISYGSKKLHKNLYLWLKKLPTI